MIAIPDKRIACRNMSLPKKNENGVIGFIYVLLKNVLNLFCLLELTLLIIEQPLYIVSMLIDQE